MPISKQSHPRPSGAFGFAAPWPLFFAALLVRLLYITLAHTYRFTALEDHFHFGWEMGRVARALVEGYGYADPFDGHTGPTAWVPPLYPLLLAGIFKTFGVYSAASAWVALALNSLFSAITALAVYEIGLRCFNHKVARWSGWLWALYPAAMQYAVRWVWEMTLTTMLFSLALVLALRMRRIGDTEVDKNAQQGLGAWLWLGLLWGLIALSNSTLLLFLPVCGIWILRGMPSSARLMRNAILSALVFLACIAPWTWRNWRVFHTFIPMRSNLGAEMWAWNNPGMNGIELGAAIGPGQDARYRAYARMGEIAYCKQQGERAKAYIRSHPGHFALLSFERFYCFWVSTPHPDKPVLEWFRELNFFFVSLAGLMGLALALKNRVPAAGFFAWAFLLVPFTYYFVIAGARFRHPLEPLIDVFAVYLFQSAGPGRRTLERSGGRRLETT